ncbi:serine/arginine repetitive matrix protein 3-like isoform X3 [Oenanthe melanoleuca]|uniref:serine/arginine repetitive matrix protein 3-like isoform X3 n=1 Tax=Oenanthe melanoleuca TaxID=2939378 RepID=UPI0024C2003D|nr:serine/arginine repetitive matrix protein 3-like isoform X3 [Oenanthe melanoleuca]
MCGPAGPASPPHQHGPASACRRPGRAAEGKFASATPHPSRSRRRSRRPGRAVAVRRTRSRPTRHPPAPPVSPPVVPQGLDRRREEATGTGRVRRADIFTGGAARDRSPSPQCFAAPQLMCYRCRGGAGSRSPAAPDRCHHAASNPSPYKYNDSVSSRCSPPAPRAYAFLRWTRKGARSKQA